MKLNNGTTVTGIWSYTPNVIYTVGDLLLGSTNGVYSLGLVTTQFTGSTSDSFNTILTNYCGFYNQSGDSRLVTRAELESSIKEALSYYYATTDDLQALDNASVTSIKESGLFLVHSTTTGLPTGYTYGGKAYLRVSMTADSVILYELLDFSQSLYYILVTGGSWTEITGNALVTANTTVASLVSSFTTFNTNLNSLYTDASNRLNIRNRPIDYIAGGTLSLFNEANISYLITLTVPTSVTDTTGSTTTYTRKYLIKIDPTDSVGTVYDEFGTILTSDYADYKTSKYSVTAGTTLDITGYQGARGTYVYRFLDANGAVLEEYEGTENTSYTITVTAPTNTVKLLVSNYNADPVVSSNGSDLTPVGTWTSELTTQGITSLLITLGTNVSISSVYDCQ